MAPPSDLLNPPNSTSTTCAPDTRPDPFGAVDWLAIAFLAALALLLASFPSRNTDLWLHLANGRAFLESASFQRSWLFNIGAYLTHAWLGATGLSLVKVLLTVALTLLLARLGWAGGGWVWVVTSTCLALLAISPRLLIQSSTASYVLLAIAAWLARPRGREASPATEWPLLVLFLPWAQLDGGFVLGLAFLACSWLGRGMDGADRSPVRTFITFGLLAGVCMLNPLHWQGFLTIPPGRSLLAWSTWADGGLRPDILAYLALLSLGLLSFVLNRPGWRWQRALPWLVFAVLSATNDRLIPYFAVVGGPALALNMQEFLGRGEPQRRWGIGRPVAVLAGVAVLLCAWPGWLQAPPYQPRDWGIEPPLSPVRVAGVIASWHREGKLPEGSRGLHLSSDTANVFAWFCPQDRPFQDREISAALRGEEDAPEGWADRLREAGVTHVVLYSTDRGQLGAALERLGGDPETWPLLLVEGDVAVFGWRDLGRPRAGDPFARLAFDPERLAYHPAPEKQAPPEPPEAVARPWWEAFWKRAPSRSIDRDEATMYLLQAEVAHRSALGRHLLLWQVVQSAGLVGSAAFPSSPPDALVNVFARLTLSAPRSPADGASVETLPPVDRVALLFRQGFIFEQDDTPPALLYLAVRAARRAIAADPSDAVAHLLLGECYVRLLHSTRERVWAARLPELLGLRRAQASAAFHEAARLRPELPQPHQFLADHYQRMGYLDLALTHLREFDKLTKTKSPRAADLADEVEKRARAYEKESDARVLDRAQAALERGLAGKALSTLLGSDIAAFGVRGLGLELDLLLKTGRVKEVREWMEPEQRQALGATTYHWLRAQALAASGDYLGADSELALLSPSLVPDDQRGRAMNARQLLSVLIGRAVLDEQPGVGSLTHLLTRARGRAEFLSRVSPLERGLKQQANVSVIRGLLALEEGRIDEAVAAFLFAKQMWKDSAAARSGAGLDFPGREAARVWLERLE
jgi:hypothetical protein